MGWCTAAGYLLAVLSSFGLEQIVFRRIAAGSGKSDWAARAFWIHNIAVTVLFLAVLAGIWALYPSAKTQLLPLFFAAQAALSLALPFKLLLNARLRYSKYAFATIAANALKLLAAYGVHATGTLTLPIIAFVMLGGNALEYGLARSGAAHEWRHTTFKMKAYRLLLKEARPQFLAVLFDVCLARLDWILLGLLASAAAVADYSFAYRAYDVEKLPTAILSSLLLPVMSRWRIGNQNTFQPEKQNILRALLVLIPGLMGWVALIAVVLWKPVVGNLLQSEFGSSSFLSLVVLNASLVFQFAINLLWIAAFAAKQYRVVARITAQTAVLNLALNLVLIPSFTAAGAAVSIIVTSAFQFFSYARAMEKIGLRAPVGAIGIVFLTGAVLLFLLLQHISLPVQLSLTFIAYPLVLWVTGVFSREKLCLLRSLKTTL